MGTLASISENQKLGIAKKKKRKRAFGEIVGYTYMRPVNAKIPIPWPRINGSICLKDSASDTGLESVSKATISQALVE